MPKIFTRRVDRRGVLRGAAVLGAAQVTSPFLIQARGETPIKIGLIDPLTGVYAALALGEVEGAKLAIEHINKKGGILGRQAELLVEDSANDVGTGVQKARKLIERDKVDFIIGDVNSGIALAIAGVTSEKKILHIVSGGHTDAVTGKDCHWNVFRVCNTTTMDVNANADTLMSKFGKKWYFITPDYAYGHSVQAAFVKKLKAAGGEFAGDLVPLGTADYSAYLIKAKAYAPKVLVNVMGGGDQVNSLKQFVQFGLGQADGRRRHIVRAGEPARRSAGSPHRLVDHGMVVGSARQCSCQGVRRRGQEGVRQDTLCTPLVRLRVGADLRAYCQSGKDDRRRQACPRDAGFQAATRGRDAARATKLQRRRSPAYEHGIRR